MLPFGSTPFGQGYWGRGDWGRRVFWENVPSDHRKVDTQGYLEGLLTTWGDEYAQLMHGSLTLPSLRDPWTMRAQEGGEWLYVTSCAIEDDATYGTVLKLYEERDATLFPLGTTGAAWLPYVAISTVGPGWRVLVENGEWPVVNVRTRNFDDAASYDPGTSLSNEVWCSTGVTLPFTYGLSDAVTIGRGDGTASPLVALPIHARLVVGSVICTIPTAWGSLVGYDDGLGNIIDGTFPGIPIATVDYELGTLTIDVSLTPPGNVTTVGAAIQAAYTVRGYFLRMRPMPLLEVLYKDFGLQADRAVPDWVQRAAFIHYRWYMGQKGSSPAYEILGSIYLWHVEAQGLWEVCDASLVSAYPPDHVFTMGVPLRYFTDIDPRRLRFDDISADVEYYDGMVGIPLLDQEIFYAGSPAWEFSKDVTQGYMYPGRVPCVIHSVTALTPAELLTYQVTYGYRVVVNMLPDQVADFNFTRRGIFALSTYDQSALIPPSYTAPAWYIDAVDSYDVGLQQWIVIVGSSVPPPVGADVGVRYWPEIDVTDCCYCRTSYVRIRVLPTAEGLAYYGVDTSADAPLIRARERLEARIEALLVPQHVRIFEFAHS